ncbi:hypothetical protein E8E15_000220 [Penicillium rubens]|nr:hypothetical protein E8E15_000220 [Penicillium rubens]KAJ5033093.1 hypothetical protein NUH16_003223 [Penicillium rubens]
MDCPSETASAGHAEEQGVRTTAPNPTTLDPSHSSPVLLQAAPGTQALAADPFEPVLEALQRLEQEDPKLAFQSARLLSLFRRVWQSYLSKRAEIQRLEDANDLLRADNTQHSDEAEHLKHQQSDQLVQLHALESALEKTRQNLLGVLEDWNSCAAADSAVVSDEYS